MAGVRGRPGDPETDHPEHQYAQDFLWSRPEPEIPLSHSTSFIDLVMSLVTLRVCWLHHCFFTIYIYILGIWQTLLSKVTFKEYIC